MRGSIEKKRRGPPRLKPHTAPGALCNTYSSQFIVDLAGVGVLPPHEGPEPGYIAACLCLCPILPTDAIACTLCPHTTSLAISVMALPCSSPRQRARRLLVIAVCKLVYQLFARFLKGHTI